MSLAPGAGELLRLGERLRGQDRDAQARRAFERARAAAEQAGDPARAAYALLRQASAELRLGLLDDARAHLARVLAEAGRLGDEPALGERPRAAWVLDDDAPLDASRRGAFGRWLAAAVQLDVGYVASLEERWPESADRLQAAVEGFEALGCEGEAGDAHRMLGITRVRAGDPTQASLAFQRAEACYQRAGDAVGLARTRAQSNKLFHDQGLFDEAVAVLDEALGTLVARGHAAYWMRYHRAMNLERLGRADEAFAELERAFDELVAASRFVTAPGARASWLESKDSIPATFLARLWSRGLAERAHEAMQRIKTSGFVELLSSRDAVGAGAADADGGDDDAARAYRAARERLAELDVRLAAGGDPGLAARRAEVLAALARLETSLDTRDVALTGAAPLPLERLQATLPPGGVLLDYVVHRDGVGVVVVTRAGRSLVPLGGFGAERRGVQRVLDEVGGRLEAVTQRARASLAMDDVAGATRLYEATGLLEELHDLLLGAPEVEAALEGGEELVVVPHRQLFGVPWHLLRRDGRYLLERLPVAVLPTLAALEGGREAPALSRASRVLFLVTGSDEARARLALDEVAGALRRFRNVCLVTGGEATRRRLEREVGEYDLIHFAGHAAFEEDLPTLSHLALGAGRHDPAWERLTVRDILQLRLRPSLVILSGCQTVRASAGKGEELLGLAQAFLVAGARAVIGTHWPFEPRASQALLPALYEGLLAGLGPAQALRQAQLALARSGGALACPYHWGAFSAVTARGG